MSVARWAAALLAVSCAREPIRLAENDASSPDAAGTDAAVQDAENVEDAGTLDAVVATDLGINDASPADASFPDANLPDASISDAFSVDAGVGGADPFSLGPTVVGAAVEEEVVRGSGLSARRIPISIHAPSGTDRRPLVVILPGFRMSRSLYAELAAHVASHGFVVARAEPPSSLLSPDHVAMAEDVGAVLDHLSSGSSASPRIDASRIALVGHSLGGKLATMHAHDDARVKALLGLDPVNAGSPLTGYSATLPDIVPSHIETLTIPIGLFGETTDETPRIGSQACVPAGTGAPTFYDAATASPWIVEWMLEGADHTDSVDDRMRCGAVCRVCQEGSADDLMLRREIRGRVTGFLLRHFAERTDLDTMLRTGTALVSVRAR